MIAEFRRRAGRRRTIAAGLSEPRDAIEDIIEPFLIQQGFIQRTPRGRVLTGNAWRHLGLDAPKDSRKADQSVQEEDWARWTMARFLDYPACPVR